MPNHFHFLIRIKDKVDLEGYFNLIQPLKGGGSKPLTGGETKPLTGFETLSEVEVSNTLSEVEVSNTLSEVEVGKPLSEVEIGKTLSEVEKEKIISRLLSQQFSNLFNGYTQAFNKQHHRKGSLFMRPFKRKLIRDNSYLLKLVHYIHYNPVESSLSENIIDWPYSSYPIITNHQETFLKREEVISWFEDRDNFIAYHTLPLELDVIEQLENNND